MSKKKLKIAFIDFWANFDFHNNLFTNLLSNHFEIEINNSNPDIIFFSVFGIDNLKYTCKKIFFTGENLRPNFNLCDYAFTFDFTNNEPRNIRLPLYALFGDVYTLTKPKEPEKILRSKSKFCNFVYSNPGAKERINFFNQLNKYKKVDSGGRFLNNIGKPVPDKLDFIKDYKFTIAFENSSHPGYTTEKIFEPMLVNSLPIYWGSPLISSDFNTKSFVNSYDFNNFDNMIQHIIELDNNDNKYMEYFNQPWFTNNQVNEFVNNNIILTKLIEIIETPLSNLPDMPRYTNRIFTDSYYKFRYFSGKFFRKAKNFSFDKLKIKQYEKQFAR